MKADQRKLVTTRLQYFQSDVKPSEIIPRLTCLTEDDTQQIVCVEERKGSRRAMMTLVDRLKPKENAFEQLVLALREEGAGHAALLLDPFYGVTSEDIIEGKEDTRTFCKIGSAVDVKIQGRIYKCDVDARELELEKQIAMKFAQSGAKETKELRKAFSEVLPQGIEFVLTKQMGGPLVNKKSEQKNKKENTEQEDGIGTEPEPEQTQMETEEHGLENGEAQMEEDPSHDGIENGEVVDMELEHAQNGEPADQEHLYHKDSIVTVFRLSSVKAVDDFKELWVTKQLQSIMQELLVVKTLEKDEEKKKLLPLELKTTFLHEVCIKMKAFLEGVDAEQEIERTGEDLLREDDVIGHMAHPLNGEIHIKIPEVRLESNDHPAIPQDLKLRKYQEELAEPAINGNNTIICAPTNSGKTFVAMEIAKKHLDKYTKESKKGQATVEIPDAIEGPKVIFIVSTQNLVLQQRSRFAEYLSTYAVSDISGVNSTEIPLEFLLKANDVVVLTAQILVNALSRENVRLSQISLIIFDECHHTKKDHVYNKIMQKYMDMKCQPAEKQEQLPKIVGLTASLGVGRSNTVENANKHIIQLCANMDALCISTVRDNMEELRDNVTGNVPERMVIRVNRAPTPSPFERAFTQVMEKIETAACTLQDRLKVQAHLSPPANRMSQQYRQWIETTSKQASTLGYRQLNTYIQQLRIYHIALLTNDTVHMKDAMTFLEDEFDAMDEKNFTDNDKMLKKLFVKAKKGVENYVMAHGEPENPKLEALKELIIGFHIKEIERGKSGSKGILFSRTRASTLGLEQWTKETDELKNLGFRPKALVGGGDGVVGMSQGEQEEIIKDFKDGVFNLLIATSVAEEGLDISDCSFVIRYDMMGNEISSTQARGRIRASEGTYAYVADARSKGHEREKLNQYREMLMADAVGNVQSMKQEEYFDEIRKLQLKNTKDRKLKEHIAAMTRNTNGKVDDAKFYCRRCNEFACEAKDFRCVMGSHYIVMDPDFRSNKIDLKPHRKPKLIDGISMDNKVHCKKCGEDWGVTAKMAGMEQWPLLKICSFVVELVGQKRRIYRKWTEAGLNIQQVDSYAELYEAGVADFLTDDVDFSLS